MKTLESLEKVNRHISNALTWIGGAALLAMMVVTCVDVIGAKVFNRPIQGSIDAVMLFQLLAISFAGASTLLVDKHVSVEFFVMLLPRRVAPVVHVVIHLLGWAVFGIVVWRLSVYGYSLQEGGELSPTVRIPLYPFAYGASLASIPICNILLLNGLSSVLRIKELGTFAFASGISERLYKTAYAGWVPCAED